MIHRAPFGSMERFMGILIEHFAGAFPFWLAPEQVRVLTISEKHLEYAQHILTTFQTYKFRAEADFRPEKIGSKIRDAQLGKVPVMLVVGAKEMENRTVSYRDRVGGDSGPSASMRWSASSKPRTRPRIIRQRRRRRSPPIEPSKSTRSIDGPSFLLNIEDCPVRTGLHRASHRSPCSIGPVSEHVE